jgi:glucose/arabinose dehydrogenase
VLAGGRLRATPFLDIRSRVRSGGEQGLLSVAFDPGYRRNDFFYVNYTDRNGDTRVVRFRARAGRAVLSSAKQLLFVRQPYANHNGGQLQFGPGGLLYVGMGDGGSGGDPENRAQNLSSRLGKLLRTNVRTRRPAWRIAAYGLRNPWRFSFDRATGDLYIGDVGQGGWEEVDHRTRAQLKSRWNFGWPVYEGNHDFKNRPVSRASPYVPPVAEYSHNGGNCSITGGYVYRGGAIPSFRGRYVYGDFCSGVVWSLQISNGRAVEVRREPITVPSLTSFGQDGAGELYAVSQNGRVWKLAG